MKKHISVLSCAYREIYWPKIRIRLGGRGKWSPAINALVDTGAVVTLAKYDVAALIGLEQVESSTDTFPVEGLAGAQSLGYGWTADIVLGSDMPPHDVSLLENARLYFTRARLPGDVLVLLGQHDFLERVELRHFNQPPRRRLVIDSPST
jgi:hypothetical protein